MLSYSSKFFIFFSIVELHVRFFAIDKFTYWYRKHVTGSVPITRHSWEVRLMESAY